MIKKFVNGNYLKRLDNIIQWQERDVFQKESVSQHSFKVSIFTRVLLEDIMGVNHFNTFKLKCVTHALFHDFDEAIFLRDLSHEIKYNTYNGEDVRTVVKDYVERKFEADFSANKGEFAYNMLREGFIIVDPLVKKVVKVADWLALLYFCRRELKLGNTDMLEIYQYCQACVISAAEEMIVNLPDCFIKIDTNEFLNNIKNIVNDGE